MATNTMRNSINVSDERIQVLCDPCRFNGKTTVAMKYCKDCNGHLCSNCGNTHMKVANTKNHHVSYIITKRTQNNQTQLSYTQSVETKCLEHGKLVVSYCLIHDALCCRVCIGSSHRECKLQILSEAASGSQDGKELRSVETGIKRLQARFEEAQKEKQANLQQLGHQNDTFTNAVKTYRRTVNNILDKLEQTLLKRKDRHYEMKVEELRGCLKTCQQAISVLNGSLNKLDIAVRQGDEQQLFMSIKKVQAISSRYEKVYMSDIDKLPKHYAFHFQPDVSIEKFLKSVSEMGQIKDESPTPNVPHAVWKTKDQKKTLQDSEVKTKLTSTESMGRIMSPRKPAASPRQPTSSEDLNVRIQSDKKTCSITGTAFLPDDRLVVADATNKKIKLFAADLRVINYHETQSAPRDVTTVSNTEIACTMPNDRSVQLIQINGKEMTTKKTMKLEVECYGIAYHDNEFYITSGWSAEKEVQVIDSEGVVRRKLRPKLGVLKCPLYVTVSFGHVYISDYENGVVGMDPSGNTVFRYNDNLTKGFMGICSSSSGDVFVCTLQPNSISRVRTDSTLYRSLQSVNESELEPLISLPNKGGQRPRSISFSRKTNKVLISFVGQNVDVVSIYRL